MTVHGGQQGFGELLLPGLRKIFFDTYQEVPTQFTKFINVQTSEKAQEKDLRMGGFGLWSKKGTMDSTNYQDITKAEPIWYTPETFSDGFQVEKELSDDDQYGTIKKLPKKLAVAARATRETQAASLLNNAFTKNGYDGVPLIHTAHPRLDGGTAVCNMISGPLNYDNLKLARQLAREQVTESGLKLVMQPKILFVCAEDEVNALELVKSINRPDNTNANNVNAMRDWLEVQVLDYLEPIVWPDMSVSYPWFIVDPSLNELNAFDREKLNFKGSTDFDTDIAKYKGRYRWSLGYSDFRGWIGSDGK